MIKLLFILSFISFTFFGFSQLEISFDRIGDLRLGSSVGEVEKLCGNKFTLPIDDFEVKFNTSVKGSSFQITFQEEEVEKVKVMVLQKISTKDPKFKTKEGAKVGMTKNDLLNLYKNFYNYQMHRAYDDETWSYSTDKLVFDLDKRLNEETVSLDDYTEYRILFHIDKGIVTEIEIMNGFYF